MANWIESEFGLAALYALIAEDVVVWSVFGVMLALGKQPPRALTVCVFGIYVLGFIALIAAVVGLFKDRKKRVAIGAVILGVCNQAFLSALPVLVLSRA